MERLDLILTLNSLLLEDMSHYRQQVGGIPAEMPSQRRLLRGLMNVRPPLPLRAQYLDLQDALLSAEREERGVVDVLALPTTADPRMVLWQGDITRLNADAIVNAANSALLGCFQPNHGCIDNAIHSAAGLQLRDECHQIMLAQGHEEAVGQAKITKAYNLPSSYVLHTVGPAIQGPLTQADCDLLASCYRSCLEQAARSGLQSVAFCCISTGEFRFPNEQAAGIAVATVRRFLAVNETIQRVIFDVFNARDRALYENLLQAGLESDAPVITG